jgi:hypothetical protein
MSATQTTSPLVSSSSGGSTPRRPATATAARPTPHLLKTKTLMITAAAGSALRPALRWGGAPSHRRLVQQHLASLPHGLPRLRHLQELHAQILMQGDSPRPERRVEAHRLLRAHPPLSRSRAARTAPASPCSPTRSSAPTRSLTPRSPRSRH